MTNTSSTKRDELRGKIFVEGKPRSKMITFFGAEIELRQPSVNELEKAQAERGTESSMADILIQYAYVPGTDEKVFEIHDLASLKELPFGPDFATLTEAITELTQIDVKAAAKN